MSEKPGNLEEIPMETSQTEELITPEVTTSTTEESVEPLQIAYSNEETETTTVESTQVAEENMVTEALTTMPDATTTAVAADGEVVDGSNVQYVTMTPEEAAAAGIVTSGEEQVMTTSLQFDPANPSVLYTSDGTPINQEDLSPEERALVETALQQHLAEQEAEQQLALIDTHQNELQSNPDDAIEGTATSNTEIKKPDTEEVAKTIETNPTADNAMPVPLQEEKDSEKPEVEASASSASDLIQSLVDNVQKQQAEEISTEKPVEVLNKPVKPSSPPPIIHPMSTSKSGGSKAGNIRYEEKIVIRQGQPHVVRVPVPVPTPKPAVPEIPDVLASLMPKVEVGKDGGQVIRIHQSQITEEQLNALKNNPNVRLVYRPPSNRSGRMSDSGSQTSRPRKRGRPRKVVDTGSFQHNVDQQQDDPEYLDEPPAKTRSGRLTKPPIYTKDYLSPKLSQTLEGEDLASSESNQFDQDYRKYVSASAKPSAYITSSNPNMPRRRGRPPLSTNKKAPVQLRKGQTYAHKIEALRAQDAQDSNFSVQAITYNKPVLTPVEQAISTRRKNRLSELLGVCSADEIMEVALPHLARGFSLWEFLVTKVEKNKKSRVHFADVYKEYESLHKYISKLAEKYKEVIKDGNAKDNITETGDNEKKPETKDSVENGVEEKKDDETNKENTETKKEDELPKQEEDKTEESKQENSKPKTIKVKCKTLAESLGLTFDELEDAEVPLIDPQEALGPYILGNSGQRVMGSLVKQANVTTNKFQDKSNRNRNVIPTVNYAAKSKDTADAPKLSLGQSAKPAQSSMITSMPPLKPLATMAKQKQAENALLSGAIGDANQTSIGVGDAPALVKHDASQTSTAPTEPTTGAETMMLNQDTTIITAPEGTGPQLIQIGQGEDQQFIEVPEGYSLIQTPEGLVMSQPGTTLAQGEDGTIYITYADGTTTPLSAAQQQSVQMETVESLLSLDGQQQAATTT